MRGANKIKSRSVSASFKKVPEPPQKLNYGSDVYQIIFPVYKD
jgi:hypothetical protein